MTISNVALLAQSGGAPGNPGYRDIVTLDLDNSYPTNGYTEFNAAVAEVIGEDKIIQQVKQNNFAAVSTNGEVLATLAAPYALANADTLIGKLDDNSSADTATITAAAAARECVNAETYALTDGMTLTVIVDQGTEQTITFLTAEFSDIGAATAEEVVAAILAQIVGATPTSTTTDTKVTITSDTAGTGSYIEVTGGTSNTALGFVTTEVQGTGDFVNVGAATIAELKAVIEAAWTYGSGCTVDDAGGFLRIRSNVVSTAGGVQVTAASTADTKMGLDNIMHTGAVPTLVGYDRTNDKLMCYDLAGAEAGSGADLSSVTGIELVILSK
jgi:hypothetical protein